MDALGVDIGGVIITRVEGNPNPFVYGDNYLSIPPVEGVFEALATLVEEKFHGRVYLVSKCHPDTRRRILKWLIAHRFFALTGISPSRTKFCRDVSSKAPIAARLRLTHFVDDNLGILGSMQTVEHRYLFQPLSADVRRHWDYLRQVRIVQDWSEAIRAILAA